MRKITAMDGNIPNTFAFMSKILNKNKYFLIINNYDYNK